MSAIDPVLESLKERGWRDVAAIDQALAEARITEDGWHTAIADLIRPAYLAADNPYGQAGHSGDATTWEASRGIIADCPSQERFVSGFRLRERHPDGNCHRMGLAQESPHRAVWSRHHSGVRRTRPTTTATMDGPHRAWKYSKLETLTCRI